GSIFGSIEALSAAGPVLLGVTPYLFSFSHQSRDRQFLADIGARFLGRSETPAAPKKAWFVDTLNDVHGVTTLVKQIATLASKRGDAVAILTCGESKPDPGWRVRNFTPVGQFTLPEHGTQTLACPPFLNVLEYCERQQLDEIIVSTPSLFGLSAV